MDAWAERFGSDLETLLASGQPRGLEAAPPEYVRCLRLAEALPMADLAADSRVREGLRCRLLDPRVERSRSRVRIAAPLAAASVLLVALAGVTPLGAAVARQVADVVERWHVGDETSVQRIDGDFVVVPGPGGSVVVRPAPPTLEPPVDSGGTEARLTLEQAAARVSFPLRSPTRLPSGYSFSHALVAGRDEVLLQYEGAPAKMLTLLARAGPVTVIWTETGGERGLIWEQNGVTYELGGRLTQADAIRMAESIPR
jgi:hypothetical protein